jgi:hypothetical protein
MLMTLLNPVITSAGYKFGTQLGFYGACFFIILFSLMFIYAAVKYAKR